MATDTVGEPDRTAREKRRLVLPLSLAGAALLLFLLLVWPTLYRYPGTSDRYRVNRLTGKAQVYDKQAEAWRPSRRGRGRNGRGTGESPYDDRGPRSEGSSPGDQGWEDGEGSGSGSGSRKPRGKQWWYSEGDDRGGSEPRGDGSPIGGSRGGGGSPIGNGGSDGGSPIGGD